MTKRKIAGILSLAYMALPALVAAQSKMPSKIVPCKGTDCTICDLATLAQNLLNAGIFIAVFMSATLFAYAGFRYLTAQGNTGQAAQARKMFTNVTVGLVIILIAWLIVDLLMKTLTSIGPWNNLCSLR